MDKKLHELMNDQIKKEIYSAYLYLDMSGYYASKGLEGFANWFYVQAQEEMSHAMLFREYILYNGEKVTLLPIDAPALTYNDLIDPLVESLKHEQYVTACINDMIAVASDANDNFALDLLTFFIVEQAEEEKTARDLIRKYELYASDLNALYQLDKDYGARTYAPPSYTFD